MKLEILATTTLLSTICLATPVKAENPAHVRQLMETGECAGCDLVGANLSGAHLIGADLRDANLKGANLKAANIEGADLTGANLKGANLTQVFASDASLNDSNLTGVKLSGAKLYNADLDGAILASVDLRGLLKGLQKPYPMASTPVLETAPGPVWLSYTTQLTESANNQLKRAGQLWRKLLVRAKLYSADLSKY